MVFPKSIIPWMSLIFLPGPAKRITPSALLKALVASHTFASGFWVHGFIKAPYISVAADACGWKGVIFGECCSTWHCYFFLTSTDATSRESSALSNGEIETVSKFARNSNFSREKETGSKTIRVRVEFLPVPHSSLQPPHNKETLKSKAYARHASVEC